MARPGIRGDDYDHSRGCLVFSGDSNDNVRPEIPYQNICEDKP